MMRKKERTRQETSSHWALYCVWQLKKAADEWESEDPWESLGGNTLGQTVVCELRCYHLIKYITLMESTNYSVWIWWIVDKFTSTQSHKYALDLWPTIWPGLNNLLLLLLLRPLFQLLMWPRGMELLKEICSEISHLGILEW